MTLSTHTPRPPARLMVSGSGTRDSPIAIDDDSEDEVISELYPRETQYCSWPDYDEDIDGDFSSHHYGLDVDEDREMVLSPRPGTFLAKIPATRLSEASAMSLKKFREDLQQQTKNRKRKRVISTPPPSGYSINALANGSGNTTLHESRKQKKTRRMLEHERQTTGKEIIEPPQVTDAQASAKAKGKQKAAQAPTPANENHHPHHFLQPHPQQTHGVRPRALGAGSATGSNLVPVGARPISQEVHVHKQLKHSHNNGTTTGRTAGGPATPVDQMPLTPIPTQSVLAPKSASTSASVAVSSSSDPSSSTPPYVSHPLPQPQPLDHSLVANESQRAPPYQHFEFRHPLPHPPPPALPSPPLAHPYPYSQESFMDPSMMQQPMGMEFDPLLPLVYMAMGGGFPMHMHMPMDSVPQQTPVPPSKNKRPVPRKASTASEKPLPQKPQQALPPAQTHAPIKQNPERPFTIRNMERGAGPNQSTAPVSMHVPIGKPDFNNKHGVFPILPVMLHSANKTKPPTQTQTRTYKPPLDRTLIMENIPKTLCTTTWLTRWSVNSCKSAPARILFGERRALLEFKKPEDAVNAWASPKLGVNEHGYKIQGQEELQNVLVFWYCGLDPDGELKLLRVWRTIKRIREEFKADCEEKIGELEREVKRKKKEGVRAGGESSADARIGLRELAGRVGFWRRLEDVTSKGMEEMEVCKWEQKEIAKIERGRRVGDLIKMGRQKQQHRALKLEEEEEGELREEKSVLRAHTPPLIRQSVFGSMNTKPVSVFHSSKDVQEPITPGPVSGTGTIPIPHRFSWSFSAPSQPQPSSGAHGRTTDPNNPNPDQSPLISSPTSASGSLPSPLPPKPSTTIPPLQPIPLTAASLVPPIPPKPANPVPTKPSLNVNTESKFGSGPVSSPLTTPPVVASASATSSLPSVPPPTPTPAPVLPPQPQEPMLLRPLAPVSTVRAQSVVSDMSVCSVSPVDEVRGEAPRQVKEGELIKGLKKAGQELLNGDVSALGSGSGPALASGSGTETTVVATASVSLSETPKVTSLTITTGVAGPRRPNLPLRPLSSEVPGSGALKRHGNTPDGLVIPSSGSSVPSPSVLAPAPHLSADVDMDMDISPTSEKSDAAGLETRIPLVIASGTSTTLTSTSSTPRLEVSRRNPPSPSQAQAIEALKVILCKSTEERQTFLEGEFKATKALMDQLVGANGREERKRITELWKEKVRVIDEVTRSIRNGAKVWYSQETGMWVRMRWPESQDDGGMFVVSDDED